MGLSTGSLRNTAGADPKINKIRKKKVSPKIYSGMLKALDAHIELLGH